MFLLLVSFFFCISSIFPVDVACKIALPVKKAKISSPFGIRQDPLLHTRKFHSGIDYSAKIGSFVKSVAKGQVVYSGKYAGFGNLVVVRHSDNLTTHYAHLWGMRVRVGDILQERETLGFLGETGRTIGPHLHFEARLNGIPINPLYLGGLICG